MNEAKSRVAVVTGASSGVGKEVAKALAAQGWRIIGTGRNSARIATAEAEIRAASASGQVDMITSDLSLMASAAQTADRIAELTDRIDLLVNNAGAVTDRKVITPEGLEANFAGNHLGPFLLTQRLLPLLRAAAKDAAKGAVRILNTSSIASEMIPAINLDDMQNIENFDPGTTYSTGKLANVLFARALAERLEAEGILAHAVHPGVVNSNFFATAPAATLAVLGEYDMIDGAEGADTLVWLATAEEAAQHNGGYWYRRQLRAPNPLVNDKIIRDRFWIESEKLIASVRG